MRISVRIVFATLVLSIFNIALLYAQTDPGAPCAGNDVDNTDCPLDTWVVFLAVIAVVLAAIYLHRKQKTPLPAEEGI